jgi:hypothetical protein
MNDFASGECGSAKNERGGLYSTYVFDGGEAEPTGVVDEVIGYIVFTVCTRYSQQFFIGEVIGYITFWCHYRMTLLNLCEV